ncbi:hypothetical protein N7532_003629 [Penicillium argentinense]|uniref:RING-type domain-containing protein n=1 Tax=Penicillium argentinense TaxID=1131581 RepID=A0A9W9FNC5_9EURO|nr:uncharacterized protein N7532_003629 [Penicillium argentinense]KAJ5103100.1 hypothetical protein N7532_003629 [Penicillium argentinense]
MAHSKRNTSLPHFTSYERSLLRNSWGTKRSVIGRDSFLPFASCKLCLQPARLPVVSCPTNGDLFCRECAINDLVEQRQEIKRLERERDEAKKRLAEEEERTLEEARQKDLHEFELISMGLEAVVKGDGKKRKAEDEAALARFKAREIEVGGERKKVFEMSEKEMADVVRSEKERLKEDLKEKKFKDSKSELPSFWVPSLTPGTDPNEIAANMEIKLAPICPGSSETHRHEYSLKTLVEVHFTEEKTADGTVSRVCPSCKKNLSNGLKAMLTKPCGHVICQPCVTKFMTPHDVMDPHATREEQAKHGLVLCYVCETDITPRGPGAEKADADDGEDRKSKKKKKKEKTATRPGLVEINSEGTGFAGGGGNVATKAGVAFQC